MMDMIPEFDHGHARTEGWDIWDMSEPGGRRFQLQRVDDPSDWCRQGLVDFDAPKFAEDDEAWKFVVGKAREGSEYHQAALEYLREHSSEEYEAIVTAYPLEGPSSAL